MQQTKKNPNQKYRYFILILVIMGALGDYYCLDIPAVLKEQIIHDFRNQYSYQTAELYYSLLYSVYNLPNMFLPLVGGFMTDKLGDTNVTVIFAIFIMIGQLVVVMGTMMHDFQVIILGRFIFGIGGESLNITVTTIAIRWFQGDELSLSQSIFLSAVRVCSISNALLTPYLSSNYGGVIAAQYFGLFLCVVSFIASLLILYFDKKYGSDLVDDQQQTDSIAQMFKNISKLQSLFWILTFITLTLYICISTFTSFLSGIIIQDYLQPTNTLEKNQEIAAKLMSLLFIMSTIFLPIIGYIVDKVGMRVIILQISSFLMVAAFSLLSFKFLLVPIVLIGFSYSLFGAIIWPVVAYLVPKTQLGTGMGLLTSLQNFGLGVAPIMVTSIKSYYGTNQSVFIIHQQQIITFFLIFAIISVFLTSFMCHLDSQREVSLNDSSQDKIIQFLEKQYRTVQNDGQQSDPNNQQLQNQNDDEEKQKLIQ